MRSAVVVVAVLSSGFVLAGCGGSAVTTAPPAAPVSVAIPPPAVSTAPGSCRAVVARTMHTVAARIEARAALHRRRIAIVERPPTLVAALTRPAPAVCAATASQTAADAVRVVAER